MTSARDAGWVLVVAAAYAASAWLAHRLAIPPGYATAVWPAAGVAVACVLCLGVRRALPGIVLGSFAHNLLISFGGAAPVRAAVIAAAIAAGAGAQAAVAGVVVRRRVAQPLVLERDGDVLRLLLLAGPCACVIGASCGTLTLLLAGAVAPADGPFTWWTWWVGDTIGTVVFAPLLLTLVGRPRSAWRSRRVTVALPLAVGFAVVTAIFVRTRRWEAARLDDDLARVERGLRRAIERDLEAADAMAAIQQVEPSLDADAFETIAAPLVAHRFGIDALVWLPRTGTAALAVHDVFPRRTEAALLGRDLAATAAARDTFARAEARGRAAASAPLAGLVDGREELLVTVPVQRGGALAGHAATLIGYHGLVDEALAGIDRRAVSLEVVDGEGAGGPVLYADAARASGEISRVVTLAVADRRWRVTIASAGGSTGRGWASWLVMAGGLSLLGGLGGVLLGVTGRAARAAALEREQDFLLRAGDAMRACQRDADVRAVTTRWLGERLAADQCFFTEVDLEQDRVTVLPGYHRGRPAAGTYRISSLAPATQTDLRAGRTVAIGDTAADPRTAPRYEQAYAPGGFRAQLGVPLLVDGVWRATLWVISSTPRAWELGELALVQSLAERAWFWVRHLRATDELERRVGERTRALEVSLREKDVLLREIHHRVKNNLQVISSLLYMQAQKSGDPRLAESLGESRERVQSIALVHDQLYRAASDAASIDLGQYLDELVRSLARAQRNPRVRVAVHADALLLPLDQAVSCGLIVNELISNALKHAFPGERAGTVTIEAHGDEGRAVVSVRDDGVGLPAGFEPSARARTGLGMVVVTTLASQLHATLTVVREPDTSFELRFPIEWTVRPA